MFISDLLKDKRIFITGGGTGIGKNMARRFMELGAGVVICGRREDVLKETAGELAGETGGGISWKRLDIRDPEAVERTLAEVWDNGPLDALVNNAAGNFLSRTEDLSHRALDAVVNIVLHGSAYMTLECGKRWIAERRPGNVLSIVTTYAWTGSGYVVPSAMGKAGVLAMTRSLAVEWGPKNIRLNAIAPGPTDTPLLDSIADDPVRSEGLRGLPNPLGRHASPVEIAGVIAFLLGPEAAYVHGVILYADAGIDAALFPDRF